MSESKLWKYLDVIKFLNLVNGELYFARADKFKDKYEGAIPKQNYLQFAEQYGRTKFQDFVREPEHVKGGEQINSETDLKRDIKKEFIRKFNERKKKVAVSCWHLNESESAAMWEIYSRAGQGIAICTTLDKLHRIKKPAGYEMEMFRVDYIDFDKTYEDGFTDYELLPFKNKRKEFEFEHEFRIMLYQKKREIVNRAEANGSQLDVSKNHNNPEYGQAVPQDFTSRLNYLPEAGIRVNIDAAELIDMIIASPEMKKYEVAEIQKLLDLINRIKGSNYRIKRSRLYENLRY